MLLIIENEILSSFTEAQRQELLTLSSKDQIYLITKAGAVISVDVIPFFTRLSAKLEVMQLATSDPFEKGYLYGALSKNGGKDKVVILSKETAPSVLDANCSWNEDFGMKTPAKRTRAKKVAVTKAPDSVAMPETTTANAGDPAPVKPRKRRSKNLMGEPSTNKLLHSPILSECADLIAGKEDVFASCLTEASDSEIGYKLLLNLKMGTDGEIIWEKTHDNFKKLKKLLPSENLADKENQ